jgi:hypothetical protein
VCRHVFLDRLAFGKARVDRWLGRVLRIAAYCALAALFAALWVHREDALGLVRGASPGLLVGSTLWTLRGILSLQLTLDLPAVATTV